MPPSLRRLFARPVAVWKHWPSSRHTGAPAGRLLILSTQSPFGRHTHNIPGAEHYDELVFFCHGLSENSLYHLPRHIGETITTPLVLEN